MTTPFSPAQQLIHDLTNRFAALPDVVAVVLGGSQSSGAADSASDIDLYVYTNGEIAPAAQAEIIAQTGGATRADLGLPYWGGVEMWVNAPTGITVDCVYFGAAWMEEQVARVMDAHQPSLGYSTCFCRTVQQSRALYDPRGWFAALQARSQQPYPDALQRNVIAFNYPVLRTMMSSYLYQLESAAKRNDLVSLNHRVAGLLASYFDIVFALNRVMHPGEKRLLAFAQRECALLPTDMDADIAAVLAAAATANGDVVAHIGRLIDRLDERLQLSSLDPALW